MQIAREKYLILIQQFLDSRAKSILVLDGPRFAGKSTIMDYVYTSEMGDGIGKKYYYSFEDVIGTKQFKDTADFMQYMQIKYGVDFHKP